MPSALALEGGGLALIMHRESEEEGGRRGTSWRAALFPRTSHHPPCMSSSYPPGSDFDDVPDIRI